MLFTLGRQRERALEIKVTRMSITKREIIKISDLFRIEKYIFHIESNSQEGGVNLLSENVLTLIQATLEEVSSYIRHKACFIGLGVKTEDLLSYNIAYTQPANLTFDFVTNRLESFLQSSKILSADKAIVLTYSIVYR